MEASLLQPRTVQAEEAGEEDHWEDQEELYLADPRCQMEFAG